VRVIAHTHTALDLRPAAQDPAARPQERLPPRLRVDLRPSRAPLLDAQRDGGRRDERAVGAYEPGAQRAAADVDGQDVIAGACPIMKD
jgi:hypothetical protein